LPKNKNYCKITLSRRDSSKEIASNSMKGGKNMENENILNVINNLEELLISGKKIELNDYEIQRLNNIINKIESTYQR
jgi:hypothetical protein